MLMSRTEARSISNVGHRTTAKMSNSAGPIQGSGPRSGSLRRDGLAGSRSFDSGASVKPNALPNEGGDPGLLAEVPAC